MTLPQVESRSHPLPFTHGGGGNSLAQTGELIFLSFPIFRGSAVVVKSETFHKRIQPAAVEFPVQSVVMIGDDAARI